ncbi:helix-turn-helix domain-containing protein [uncultured Alistipes sp.]|uniref:helix-turn-helix domain-containing protein n=1 Tax=uncultured Alistipes sp. TaxID=538949 RepID=UPI002803C989|nr:helix-turn-helix domain-containing protein [uncultured Alistipes sp.]
MNEKEILSISLASLVEIYPPQASDLYYDGCILGRRETLENESAMKLFRFPTRINALGVLFCSKGSISISSDLEHHVINPRSMFVCPPGSIVQIESEQDAAVHFIFCEEEFVNRVHLDQKQLLHLFMEVRTTPCLQLDDSEWSSINHTLEEIFTEGRSGREDLFSAEIMYSLFRALAYRISRVIDDRMKTRKETPSLPRHTAYFNAFIEELSHNYMQERSVGFYADRLHLTPKYLTTLLRTTTGRTATQWIDDYVVLEAKNLLKYSSMNIQEVAYYLHFPNQSFFGKYFKQHTGMTPSAYRASK